MSLSEEQKTFFTNDFSHFWPFIEKIDVDREPAFYDLEKQCQQYGVYTVGPWFGKLLHFFVRFGNVKTALEFGTASGYSAIWIAKALAPDGHLTTIERETRLAELARDNIAACGLQNKVTVVNADASTALQDIQQEFDLIFVDCAHFEALRFSEKHLRKNGLFICDNIGFVGFEGFNETLLNSSFLETIYLQCYLKHRDPENTAFSISMKV